MHNSTGYTLSVSPSRRPIAESVDQQARLPRDAIVIKVPLSVDSSNTTRKRLVESGLCHNYNPTAEVVILRMYGSFSDNKKTVITRYATQLRDMRDLWVLYDVSSTPESDREELEVSIKTFQTHSQATFNVFLYDTDLELRMFPTAEKRFAGIDLNYFVHGVSVVSWWRICGRHNWGDLDVHMPSPKHVWIVETDAAFSGDVSTFFDFYANRAYDLIVPLSYVGETWWLEEKRGYVRDESTLPWEAYYRKPDFVNRLSSRLLYHMDLMLQADVMYYGEAFEITLCRSILRDWCKWRDFIEDDFVGEVMAWDAKISSEDWTRYNEETQYLNRWYHALEELKEHRRFRGLLA